MRRIAGVVVVLGALLVIAWPARAEPTTSEIHDNYFVPVPITVNLGDSVTWTDFGNNPHSVTASDPTVFDSSPGCLALTGTGCMANGETFTVTFNTAGRFSYFCRVHGDAMVGTVIVESAATTTTTASTSTTVATTSTSVVASDSSTALPDDRANSASARPLPGPPPNARATARSISQAKGRTVDDLTPWVLADVLVAGATTIAGIMLIRRGRIPFG